MRGAEGTGGGWGGRWFYHIAAFAHKDPPLPGPSVMFYVECLPLN